MFKKRGFWAVIALILVGAALRLAPHPSNVTPIMAIALFSGAVLGRHSVLAWFAPLVALFISDLVLGFHGLMPFVYGAFFAAIFIGRMLGDDREGGTYWLKTGGAAIAASLMFFLVSNFGVWFEALMYPRTSEGLVASYIAGLPFLGKELVGDLFYTYFLFGAWSALCKISPRLADIKSSAGVSNG